MPRRAPPVAAPASGLSKWAQMLARPFQDLGRHVFTSPHQWERPMVITAVMVVYSLVVCWLLRTRCDAGLRGPVGAAAPAPREEDACTRLAI